MGDRRQRVLVVGLGTMGLSHARAYRRSTASNSSASAPATPPARSDLDAEFPGVPRFDDFDEALAALKPDAVAIAAYTEHHAPMALQALAAGAHVFCEKPLADTLEAAETVVAAARAAEQGAAGRLHPARPSLLDPLRRDRPHARQAAGHADEPQPAVVRLVLGGAQEPDALDLADRRLRRALCRRDVPGDAGEAGARPCGRRAADRRDRADDGQLRPSAHRLRRRLGRLVRGRLGADDERDRLLREGHDRARRAASRSSPGRAPAAASNRPTTTATRATNALRIHHAALDAEGRFANRTRSRRRRTNRAIRTCASANSGCSSRRSAARSISPTISGDALNSLRIVFAADESMRTGRGREAVAAARSAGENGSERQSGEGPAQSGAASTISEA